MKKIIALMLIFIFVLSGCQNDLPAGAGDFSSFEGYNKELSEEELNKIMKNGKVELENRPDENICYVNINCKTAIENEDISDSILAILPEDGILLDNVLVEYEEGATVFDVLAKIVREEKIHMEYTGSAKIPYIEGIANLYEFECGPLSGWMYQVNGWFPSFSMGQYKIEPGDTISFVYTCDLGEDVGDTYMH